MLYLDTQEPSNLPSLARPIPDHTRLRILLTPTLPLAPLLRKPLFFRQALVRLALLESDWYNSTERAERFSGISSLEFVCMFALEGPPHL